MIRFALPAVAGLMLCAAGARADGPNPAAVDLRDLKHAVAAARKRGDNVDAVAEALAALEKSLDKGAAKPGAAPPELAALREAVEAAGSKGENVEAISKELGRVEKALTGREYQRPVPPEPKAEPEPVPPPFRPGARPGFGRRVVVVAGNGNFNSTAITVSNGRFSIRARKGDVSYTITGAAGDPDALTITVRAGAAHFVAKDVKKLPEVYRPAAESLLKMVPK